MSAYHPEDRGRLLSGLEKHRRRDAEGHRLCSGMGAYGPCALLLHHAGPCSYVRGTPAGAECNCNSHDCHICRYGSDVR